jgi:hypothetical protein
MVLREVRSVTLDATLDYVAPPAELRQAKHGSPFLAPAVS